MHRRVLLIVVSALVLSACGGAAEPPASTPAPIPSATPRVPGEIVVSGDASPASHGPYRFHGRYTVHFEQRAPEDPSLDFTQATSFVAMLDRVAEVQGGDSIALFEASRSEQSRTVRIDGPFFVDVSFGDFPYVIRFTPRG